jgi:hypothetical protein
LYKEKTKVIKVCSTFSGIQSVYALWSSKTMVLERSLVKKKKKKKKKEEEEEEEEEEE